MPRPAESAVVAWFRLAGFALIAAWLASCAVKTHPPATARPMTHAPGHGPTVTSPSAPPADQLIAPAVTTLLAYADKLGALSPADWQAQADQLRQQSGALAALQLALLHAQKQPPETARALELATQAQADGSPEGLQLQPVARLLVARLTEQKRLEEQLDKQGKQLAEVQRRLDQSLERLEALKAIERSLAPRTNPTKTTP